MSTPVRQRQALRIVSKCRDRSEFVRAFARFTRDGALFIPTSRPRTPGVWQFALTLADGAPALRGIGRITEVCNDRSNPQGMPGMWLRFDKLDANSQITADQLFGIQPREDTLVDDTGSARAVTKPQVFQADKAPAQWMTKLPSLPPGAKPSPGGPGPTKVVKRAVPDIPAIPATKGGGSGAAANASSAGAGAAGLSAAPSAPQALTESQRVRRAAAGLPDPTSPLGVATPAAKPGAVRSGPGLAVGNDPTQPAQLPLGNTGVPVELDGQETSIHRRPGANRILPANPFGDVANEALEGFVECSLYEDTDPEADEEEFEEYEVGKASGLINRDEMRLAAGTQPSARIAESSPPPIPPAPTAQPPAQSFGSPVTAPTTPAPESTARPALPGMPEPAPAAPPTAPPRPHSPTGAEEIIPPAAAVAPPQPRKRRVWPWVLVAILFSSALTLAGSFLLWGGTIEIGPYVIGLPQSGGAASSDSEPAESNTPADDQEEPEEASEGAESTDDGPAATTETDEAASETGEGDEAAEEAATDTDADETEGEAAEGEAEAEAEGDATDDQEAASGTGEAEAESAETSADGPETADATSGTAEGELASDQAAGSAAGAMCKLNVRSRPSRVAFSSDGVELGVTPKTVELPCGSRTIKFERKQFESSEKSVTLEPGKTARINLTMKRPRHRLVVTTNPPRAVVRIAGRRVGKTPLSTMVDGYTTVRVRVSLPGYKTATRRVYMANKKRGIRVTLKPAGGSVLDADSAFGRGGGVKIPGN